MPVDRVSEAELNAFVDGQLDPVGCVEVQDFLARHPDLAARVMADLSMRESLRLAIPSPVAPPRPETLAAARRLSSGLRMRRALAPLQRIAAGIAIFALGWTASHGWDRVREFSRQEVAAVQPAAPAGTTAPAMLHVVEAARGLDGQPAKPAGIIDASHLDPAKLGAAVQVRLPRIPHGWTVVGTRLVDAEEGTALEVVLDTPEFGRLLLLARHTQDVAIVLPTIAKAEGEPTAYWQLVSDSYALTGNLARKPLEFAALELFQTLY
jgi:anti-sigma factor RsiW